MEIVSRKPDKTVVRSNYTAFYLRARRLAAALTRLGLRRGDRVAAMMWNHVAISKPSLACHAPAVFCIV